MKITFQTEDTRKDKLFAAWGECILEREAGDWPIKFHEIYEGPATLLGVSKGKVGLELEDGRKFQRIDLDWRVGSVLKAGDSFDLVLGRFERKWFLLEILTVASFVRAEGRQLGVHLTVHPELGKIMREEQVH